ncbi:MULTISPECIES: PIG-L family deacetylase [unclassified Mesorhizobium]|uniref:PIG-L family deacetylase n=1 Tax=unclassified Mesorhizobium TaxID=325217 RepID=UPI0015E3E2B6|nr:MULTISPECIES: PIG-L family deacetylase [unclassified Mesorhizobium]
MNWNAIASFGPKTLHGLSLAAQDFASRRRPVPAGLTEASAHDLYLAPHCDDICFSLGAFVLQRRKGALLTLFSKSGYVAQPRTVAALGDERIAAISSLRQREDLAFATQVGLRLCFGGLDEASLRGHDPFDTAKADDDARQLDGAVVAAIFAAATEQPKDRRPWLFCPMAIGGHVDHMVVLKIVLRHYNALRARWRIAFYEDLHYASAWQARTAGLARFEQLAARLKPRRSLWPIGAPADKLALAALYRSQFVELPASIKPFTPAQRIPAPAHEALWSAEQA